MELQKLQLEILENSLKYLKPNGTIIYSTCTTEEEENYDVIKNFLSNHQEFEIDNAGKYVNERAINKEGCIELFPHIHHTDGIFSARLIRRN